MAILTTLEQLEEVQAAISAIMTTGQSYSIDGQSFTRADLDKLTIRETMLLKRYAAETSANRPRVSSTSFIGA
jgi:hypothetical protein